PKVVKKGPDVVKENPDLVAKKDPVLERKLEPVPLVFKSFEWNRGEKARKLLDKTNGFAVLTAVSGKFDGGGEHIDVQEKPDGWYLEGGALAATRGEAVSVEFANQAPGLEIKEYQWKQGDQPVKMIAAEEGFCFLSSVSGKFQGGGESVRVHLDKDGFW